MLGLHRGPDGPSAAELLASTAAQTAPQPLSCWPPPARPAWMTSCGGTESGGWGAQPVSLQVSAAAIAYYIPGHSRPVGCPRLMWMDTAMHDMGSLGHTLQIETGRT